MKILDQFITLLKTPTKGDKAWAGVFTAVSLLFAIAGYYYSPVNYIRAVIVAIGAFYTFKRSQKL